MMPSRQLHCPTPPYLGLSSPPLLFGSAVLQSSPLVLFAFDGRAWGMLQMIELRLSQGAKPGYKGLLPAALVTPEVAKSCGVRIGEACFTPPTHPTFDGPRGMVDFVDLLRELSGGKPVGVKMSVPTSSCQVYFVHSHLTLPRTRRALCCG